MKKYLLLSTLLFATPLAFADTLTAKVNKTAYDYALAMFAEAEVTESMCPAEKAERTGFFYLCGTTTLDGEALEGAWTPATRDYGATTLSEEEIADDAWESTGSGGQGLEVVVDGEFIIIEYGPAGEVSVQSGQTF